MVQVLVAFHSKTGSTRRMAELVADGAREAGAEVLLKPIAEVAREELESADAIIVGSPTYYGHCAGPVRTFFDESVRIHGKLSGKVGGAFTSSHNLGGGNETTILGILESMLVHGMVIRGSVDGDHYGPVSLGPPDARAEEQCRALGDRVTALASRLKGS